MSFRTLLSLNLTKNSIVAVHGLNPRGSTDHAFSTWTAANGSLWLKDLLPTEIPNARILVYSYNSSAVFHASQQGIEGEARELMDRVLYRREVCMLQRRDVHRVCSLIDLTYHSPGP